ncbi:MAG: hypothetical protein U9Q97_06460 [Acidobacteriota bacterium]|nr:hypothetical protein [Acidobacteriota bacterium]
MARSKTISVTPNVHHCLKVLKAAVKSMPAGDLKKNAEGALNYLNRTFKGEPQPMKGRKCPAGLRVVGN